MAQDLNVEQIKKLWLLDLVLQQGSLKRAALAAKISPSAVSQSLTALETSLGKTLLIREKGKVLPTLEGQSILEVVRPAFDVFDRLRDLNGFTNTPKISWINFGTYESIAIDLLPGLLHSIKAKLPNIRLSVKIARTNTLLSMVRKGDLCSALITQTDNLERFYVKEVATDRLGLFVSRYHPISEIGERAVDTYGVGILSPSRDGFPRYFSKFIKDYGLTKPIISSDSFECLRAAAVSGSMVALLPSRIARRDDSLIEITELMKKSGKRYTTGEHKILIVSQLNCDREETDFMAKEATKLLDTSR